MATKKQFLGLVKIFYLIFTLILLAIVGFNIALYTDDSPDIEILAREEPKIQEILQSDGLMP